MRTTRILYWPAHIVPTSSPYYVAHMRPILGPPKIYMGQPTWAPPITQGQNNMGPTWVAHMGPTKWPMLAPHGALIVMLAGNIFKVKRAGAPPRNFCRGDGPGLVLTGEANFEHIRYLTAFKTMDPIFCEGGVSPN